MYVKMILIVMFTEFSQFEEYEKFNLLYIIIYFVHNYYVVKHKLDLIHVFHKKEDLLLVFL